MIKELSKEMLESLVEKLVRQPASEFKQGSLEYTYYDKKNNLLISIESHPYADSDGRWGNDPFYFIRCYIGNTKNKEPIFENQSDERTSILEKLYHTIDEKVLAFKKEREKETLIKNEKEVIKKLNKFTRNWRG